MRIRNTLLMDPIGTQPHYQQVSLRSTHEKFYCFKSFRNLVRFCTSFHFVLSLRHCFSTSIFNFLLHDVHFYFLQMGTMKKGPISSRATVHDQKSDFTGETPHLTFLSVSPHHRHKSLPTVSLYSWSSS